MIVCPFSCRSHLSLCSPIWLRQHLRNRNSLHQQLHLMCRLSLKLHTLYRQFLTLPLARVRSMSCFLSLSHPQHQQYLCFLHFSLYNLFSLTEQLHKLSHRISLLQLNENFQLMSFELPKRYLHQFNHCILSKLYLSLSDLCQYLKYMFQLYFRIFV